MATIAAIPAIKSQTDSKRAVVRKQSVRAMAFMVIDSLIAFTAFGGASALAGGYTPIMNGAIGSLVIPLSFITVMLYDQTRAWSRWQILYECLKGATVAAIALGILAFFAPDVVFSAYRLALGLFVATALTAAWRVSAFSSFSDVPERRILVLGQGDLAKIVTDELASRRQIGYRLVHATEQITVGTSQTPVVEFDGLSNFAIDVVAVSPSTPMTSEMRNFLVRSMERGVAIVSLLHVYEEMLHRVPLRFLDEGWFAEVLERSNRKGYDLGKRLLDIGVAIIGLLLTAILLPSIALAIFVGGGKGSLIYSQIRVGLRGQKFTIYKFRSMAVDAERDGPLWASENDSRVTTVGRLLRQTRLDELPQFWNVLRGEMSVVGPRPERPEFVGSFNDIIPFYAHRHDVLPGLTGWAQVMFPYGASVEDAFEKLQYDLYYLKNRSFYLDLKIMIKTIGVMAKKIGSR